VVDVNVRRSASRLAWIAALTVVACCSAGAPAGAQVADGVYAGGSGNAVLLVSLDVSGQSALATVAFNSICHGATTSTLRSVPATLSADGSFSVHRSLRQSAWRFTVSLAGQIQGNQVNSGHFSVATRHGSHRCSGVSGPLDLRLAEPLPTSPGSSFAGVSGWFAGGTIGDPRAPARDRPIMLRSKGAAIWGDYAIAVPCAGHGTLPAFVNTTTNADLSGGKSWDAATEPDYFSLPQRGTLVHYHDLLRLKWVRGGVKGVLRVRARYRRRGRQISCDTGWLRWEAATVTGATRA
jgi:hypothetical protein